MPKMMSPVVSALIGQVTHILKEQGKDMNGYKFMDMLDGKTILLETRPTRRGAAHITYNEGTDDYTVKRFKSEPFPVCVSSKTFESVTIDQLPNFLDF